MAKSPAIGIPRTAVWGWLDRKEQQDRKSRKGPKEHKEGHAGRKSARKKDVKPNCAESWFPMGKKKTI